MVIAIFILTCPICLVLLAAVFNGRMPTQADFRQSLLFTNLPKPLDHPITLKVVTFNVHGLYVASRDRAERMQAIADTLTSLDPDIVGLQETFVENDRMILSEGLGNSRLKYQKYYPSATVGSGLLVLSAFPIVEGYFHRYVQNGKWYKLYHGDWWAGKGVALARLALPNKAGYVDFYNTHAHAGYGGTEYDEDRKAQMLDLSRFVDASGLKVAPAIVVGDMNCRPGSDAFNTATQKGRLERLMDCMSEIDHIFGVQNGQYTFSVLNTQPIQKLIKIGKARQTPLSDHTGYMSTIKIEPIRTIAEVDPVPVS